MSKVGGVTEAVFEFIREQNSKGTKLHEFDIISRFKNVIGYVETAHVLTRLAKKHHILKTDSTRRKANGNQTFYYRVNAENPYDPSSVRGRKADPEKLKKLETLSLQPFEIPEQYKDIPAEPKKLKEASTAVISEQLKQLETVLQPVSKPSAKVEQAWSNMLGSIRQPHANGVGVLGRPDVLKLLNIEPVEDVGQDEAVMFTLDLGSGRTEMVDAKSAYKLYLGLHAIFGMR